MKPNVFFLLAFPMLLFFSCSGDDDGVAESDRSQALLGQWEYEAIDSNTAVDINGDGTVNVDLFNTNEIRQCLKDNLTFFSSRGPGEKSAFSINENGLSCGEVPAFQNVEDDRYELINNEIIRFENRNDWVIVEFTKNRLVVDQEDFLDDQDVVITYTFKRS
tara:strand:+ start:1767 stop:2252 length:486 start_codon:yes stop_codon:yes gene_type:complete